MNFKLGVREVCLGLGFLYLGLVGFLRWPVNLQASLSYMGFFAVVWMLSRGKGKKSSVFESLVFLLGGLLAVFFALTTNELMVRVTYLSSNLLALVVLLGLFEGRLASSPFGLLQSSLVYVKYFFAHLFSASRIREFLGPIKLRSRVKFKLGLSKDFVQGVIVALPILALFHVLFAQVNGEYAAFMDNILVYLWEYGLVYVWRALKFLVNIEALWWILKGLVQGYVFFTMFTLRRSKREDEVMSEHLPLTLLKTLVGMIVVLFLVFSSFQSQELFVNVFKLSFLEVSQYVQRGFGELLVVALIGYLVMSLVLVKTHVDDGGDIGLRGLLTIFGVELILVAVFAGHKLFALQATYGFKDQRLLATGAVGLIFMTFVLVCLRVWGRVGSIQIFRAQVVGLAGVVLFLNLVNVDALVSRVNPIRYEQEGQVYLDYSYLIGNSYDNVGSWEKLMREFMESDVPRPSTTYYWGHFSSSRADYYGGSYSPICEERSVYDEELKIMVKRPFTYFEEYFEDLARLGSGESLIEKSRWNLREAEAREFAEGNPELVKDFLGHAKGVCG